MSKSGPKMLAAMLLVLATAGAGFADRPPEGDRADVAALVASQSDFAFALYARLRGGNEGQNLFFSPYSLSTALLMAAEGARGQTAEEMGKALRFPETAHRQGADAVGLPWDTTWLHAAAAALRRQLQAGSKPPPPEVRERIETLREDLDRANRLAAAMRRVDEEKQTDAALESQRLARELNALLPRYNQYELSVASALWAEKTYPVRESYRETLTRYYGTGGISPVDFRGDAAGARRKINAWVAEQTSDRIRELIGPDMLGPLTRLVLTNAVYFKGRWADEFDTRQTRPGDFLLAGGGKVRVPLMHRDYLGAAHYAAFRADGTFFDTPAQIEEGEQEQSKLYPGEKGFLMLELPYKGQRVSLVVLAPRSADGLASLEKQLTAAHFRAWAAKLQQRPVHVFLPKIKVEAAYDLGEALKALGMVRAFEGPSQPGGADFSGMSASTDPRQQPFISKVLHKALVEVNEKGTEAAAATAVMAPKAEARPERRLVPFTPTFRADRPFVFLIRDRQTGSILFLGRVTNPGSSR